MPSHKNPILGNLALQLGIDGVIQDGVKTLELAAIEINQEGCLAIYQPCSEEITNIINFPGDYNDHTKH